MLLKVWQFNFSVIIPVTLYIGCIVFNLLTISIPLSSLLIFLNSIKSYNRTFRDLQVIENKSKEEHSKKIADNSRHKKRKKKKSKNNQQQFLKTDKISGINLKPTDISKNYCDTVNHIERKDNKKELKKPGKKINGTNEI